MRSSKRYGAAGFEAVERQRADDDLLDGVVGQHLVADAACDALSASRRRSSTCAACAPRRRAQPKSRAAASALWATGSMTPGLSSTWTSCGDACAVAVAPAAPAAARVVDRGDDEVLGHRVGEQLAGQPFDVGLVERRRLRPDSRAPRRRARSSPSRARPTSAATPAASRSGSPCAGVEVNLPEHRESVSLPASSSGEGGGVAARLSASSNARQPVFEPPQGVEHRGAVLAEDLRPQLRVAGGDPRRVAPAGGRPVAATLPASAPARAAAIRCGRWLVAASARSCSSGLSSSTSAPSDSQNSLARSTRPGGVSSSGVTTTVRSSSRSAAGVLGAGAVVAGEGWLPMKRDAPAARRPVAGDGLSRSSRQISAFVLPASVIVARGDGGGDGEHGVDDRCRPAWRRSPSRPRRLPRPGWSCRGQWCRGRWPFPGSPSGGRRRPPRRPVRARAGPGRSSRRSGRRRRSQRVGWRACARGRGVRELAHAAARSRRAARRILAKGTWRAWGLIGGIASGKIFPRETPIMARETLRKEAAQRTLPGSTRGAARTRRRSSSCKSARAAYATTDAPSVQLG